MFTLEFETDNDAFAENPEIEIARILKAIADKVHTNDGGYIKDLNGNQIGTWDYTPPEKPELVVDGHETEDPESPLSGDGEFAPFWVFDATAQRNVAGPFSNREDAQAYIDGEN